MTGIEALQALMDGRKVRRENWFTNEVLLFDKGDGYWQASITPSYAFSMARWNRINKNEPRDLDLEFRRIYTDFLQDDWEIVE